MPLSKYLNSITLRLLLLFVTTGVLILFVFQLTTSISLNNLIETKIRPTFIHYADYIVKEIGNPPSIEKAKEISQELAIGITINGKMYIGTPSESPLISLRLNSYNHK